MSYAAAPKSVRCSRAAILGLRSVVERVDREMARTHAESGVYLLLSSAAFGLGSALGAVESYLALWFLGVPVTVERALAIEVLGVAVNNVLFFVPFRAGVREAGKVPAVIGSGPGARRGDPVPRSRADLGGGRAAALVAGGHGAITAGLMPRMILAMSAM